MQKDLKQHIYIVDFGLAKQFIDPKTGKHIDCGPKQHFIGTAGYSSLNSHRLIGKLSASPFCRIEPER